MSVANPTSWSINPSEHPVAHGWDRASVVRLTVEQYTSLIREQIVPEDSTIELLHGIMFYKDRSILGEPPMGHSPLHAMIVGLLAELGKRIPGGRHMQIQLPVQCPPDGMPEPDASIVRGSPRDYSSRIPAPSDVICVFEVSHSSLERDREDKLAIYAGAGIGQYVIINLQNLTVELYTQPDVEGEQYRVKRTMEKGTSFDIHLDVEEKLVIETAEILP